MRKLERVLPAMLAVVGAMWIAVAVLYRIFASGSPTPVIATAIAAAFFAASIFYRLRGRANAVQPRHGHS
ncbi:hypothetical protein [Gryllotalpicola protaetiae]|uniref:Uncharacterized protein n=1 Tax=Gryllotalpicola protaetiae TaxID=2419771 RepID=A0A387BUM5_9MICO|nr:hypothetical protein [Gryllotalpicola protaetiae]AYG02151.1 hypothetical protein D7I44_00470 [Gryllotalpicola protaetiae]